MYGYVLTACDEISEYFHHTIGAGVYHSTSLSDSEIFSVPSWLLSAVRTHFVVPWLVECISDQRCVLLRCVYLRGVVQDCALICDCCTASLGVCLSRVAPADADGQ